MLEPEDIAGDVQRHAVDHNADPGDHREEESLHSRVVAASRAEGPPLVQRVRDDAGDRGGDEQRSGGLLLQHRPLEQEVDANGDEVADATHRQEPHLTLAPGGRGRSRADGLRHGAFPVNESGPCSRALPAHGRGSTIYTGAGHGPCMLNAPDHRGPRALSMLHGLSGGLRVDHEAVAHVRVHHAVVGVANTLYLTPFSNLVRLTPQREMDACQGYSKNLEQATCQQTGSNPGPPPSP